MSVCVLLVNHVWVSELLVQQVTILLQMLEPTRVSDGLRLEHLHLIHILVDIIMLQVHLVHLIHLHLLLALLVDLHVLLLLPVALVLILSVLGSN